MYYYENGYKKSFSFEHTYTGFLVCLFVTQPEQAVLGEEMLATAVLFVKLDSAKNLPVSVQACF